MKAYKVFPILCLPLLLCFIAVPATAEDLLGFNDDEILAYRWRAIANFYDSHNLLNPHAAFFVEADECLCFRWEAMASYYQDHAMLTRYPMRPTVF